MKLLLWDAIRRKFGKDDKKIDIDTEEISEKEDLEALTFKFHYLNIFKRSADFKIKAVEEEKTVRFTFDKRDILIPKNYKTGLDLTPKEIWDLDPSDEKVGEKMWDIVKEIRTKPKTEPACVLTKEEISKWWESVNQKTKNR